jgi:D-serine deaminase-like pyridoxal phosphate-dependent protein
MSNKLFPSLATPTILLDLDKMEANIAAMQAVCDEAGVELRPHIKSNKMVEVVRRQLQAGAAGITCAKLGEAEAVLPAFDGARGRREVFVAHSIVDENAAPRLQRLNAELDELALACTSELHAPALEAVVAKADLHLPVIMALDTGLGREGARDLDGAVRLAETIARQPHLELKAIYTHEGHFYGKTKAEADTYLEEWHQRLLKIRDAIAKVLGSPVKLWPGCSVSAARVARLSGIDAVRPGAYIFGDIGLSESVEVMTPDAVALSVLATVVDRPEPGLALLDSGTKTLSTDKARAGMSARSEWGLVMKANEEHGYLTGEHVDDLVIGQQVRLIPAHVCPVINLTDTVTVVRGNEVVDTWRVEARGKTQ